MENAICIRRVRDPYGGFGNMSPHPVSLSGMPEFRTAEALFQALRFPPGSAEQEAIRACTSPMAAKMKAKELAAHMIIVPRSREDVENMRRVLEAKIRRHPELAAQLLDTEFRLIVEDCSARPTQSGLFWGAAHRGDGRWEGENMLGRMWMDIRAELRLRGNHGENQ